MLYPYKAAKVADLIPYARNARTHSDEQVAQIAASIREFGFINPVIVDGDRGIVAGHGRVMAARKLGLTDVPTLEVGHLTDAQRKAYVLADNKLALNAGWDNDLLKVELAELNTDGFDLSLIGFSTDELAALLADKTEGLTDPDETPEPPVHPVSELGDVWVLGKHRLVCGDCTDIHIVNKVLGQARPHLTLTDPPYGLGSANTDKNAYGTYNDTLENLRELIAGFLPIAREISKAVVLTPGNANQWEYPRPDWTMAWFTPAGVGSGPWGFCCWQPILCFGKDPQLSRKKGRHPDALVHTEKASSGSHPCAKPIMFWKWLMERVSVDRDHIYEPFSGSGTTIIAGEMTDRHVYAVEINPAYVDVAVQRWQDFTGQEAVLDGDGRTFNELKAVRHAAAA